MIYLRPHVKKLPDKSYEAESAMNKGNILDCALGRNSFGTSKRVIEFASKYDSWSDLWQHPDTSYKELKHEICKFWSKFAELEIDNIKVANGSCVVLSRLSKLFIGPRIKVLGYVPQFKEYMLEVKVLGGHYEALKLDPKENFKFNTDSFLRRINQAHRVIYLDNPNNPTGQLISLNDIEKIVSVAKKKDVIVILDEAYGDYVEERHSAVNLTNKFKNLLITRTFTKGYGVGQFRVGYAILPVELGKLYSKIELPFSVSVMGAALAREALRDQDFVITVREQVKVAKEKLTMELRKRGYLIGETCNSVSLFIMGHKDMNINLKDHLLNKGILTTSPGTDWENLKQNWVRVNISPQIDAFLTRLDN